MQRSREQEGSISEHWCDWRTRSCIWMQPGARQWEPGVAKHQHIPLSNVLPVMVVPCGPSVYPKCPSREDFTTIPLGEMGALGTTQPLTLVTRGTIHQKDQFNSLMFTHEINMRLPWMENPEEKKSTCTHLMQNPLQGQIMIRTSVIPERLGYSRPAASSQCVLGLFLSLAVSHSSTTSLVDLMSLWLLGCIRFL